MQRGDRVVELHLPRASVGERVGAIAALREAGDEAARPGRAPNVVHAHVTSDLQEPGAGGGLSTEASQGRQRPEVDLLGEVVRVVAIAQPGAEAPDLRLRSTHERSDGHAVAIACREGEPGEIVHKGSLVGGNQGEQSSDHLPMDCMHLREALSARLDDEDLGVDSSQVDAHLAGCPACAAFAREVGVLHRMTRVRAAEEVPDLSAAIVAALAGPSATARSPFSERVSVARWALFAVALTQLVLAAPALLLGEDAGATVHVARELGSFDAALAVGLLVAAWQPARAWGLLPVAAALGLVMAGTAVLDVVDGSASTPGEAHHLLDLAGVALLWLVARAVRPARGPGAAGWAAA